MEGISRKKEQPRDFPSFFVNKGIDLEPWFQNLNKNGCLLSRSVYFLVLFLVKQYGYRIFVIAIRNLRPIGRRIPAGIIQSFYLFSRFNTHFSCFESLFPSIVFFVEGFFFF